MANYQTFREQDLGGGVDQQSAENMIPAGYVESLKDVDPLPTGQLKVRKGYEGYLGYVPVRVLRMEYTDALTNNICLYLDGSVELASVDLTTVRKNPVILLGKTSKANVNNVGDFPLDQTSIHWYETFTTEILKLFNTGTDTLSIPQSEHTVSSPYMFIGTSMATSQVNTSNSVFTPDEVRINKATNDIDIDYTNNTGAAFQGYVYISNQQAVAGESYVSGVNSVAPGTQTINITAATHGLNNFNIIPQLFEDTGTEYRPILPDEFILDTSGDVSITLTNSTAASIDVIVVLATAPVSNVASGSVASGSSVSVVISDIQTDFIFASCYLEQTLGGDLELVLPESIVIDHDAGTATITFVNNSGSGKNFEIYYKFVNIASNKLCVSGSTITSLDEFQDSAPQLTLYGIPHSELYGDSRSPREGWVNHIDAYRSTAEDRLIAGLGGNLFAGRLRAEDNNADDYLMPLYYPDLRSRVLSDVIIGPAFIDTSDISTRSRGYIQADTAGSNFLQIDTATYDSNTTYVVYRLLAPNLTVNGTLSTIISTTAGMEDLLLVQQMGYSRLNGQFKIKSVMAGVDYLDIAVENPNIDSSDYDEIDAGGQGGIFTDQIELNTASPFIPNDVLDSEVFEDYEVIRSNNTTVIVNNVIDEVSLPSGLRIVASRQGRVIPLRTAEEVKTVENLVRGDMLMYTPVSRKLRAVTVNPNSDEAVTITADGFTATVTMTNTSGLKPGDYVLIRDSLYYTGEQQIVEVPNLTTFTFSTSLSFSDSGTLIGKNIVVDETLEIADGINSENTIEVQGRWIPIEAPEDEFDLTASTYVRHFDKKAYTQQDILRSTMVQDNMYLTNGNDEVMKFDGVSLYRAGLPRWQGNLFMTKDTTATGVIVLDNPQISYSANSSNYFTAPLEDKLVFQIGQKIEDSVDGSIYTITDIGDNSTDSLIYVNKTIGHATSTGTLTRVSTFKYYGRLNAVDVNNNIIASAVVGADDMVVEIGANAAVRLRAIGMAALDNYDYDRLEWEWYRTKANSVAPYYKLTSLPLSFNSNDGYIDYIDTAVDSDLTDFDPVSTVLEGAELGTGWSEPMRAKYVTSSENRLILANVKDYPTIDIQLLENDHGPITIADLTASDNKRWLFRKDNTDAGTTTDMISRFAIEFVSTASAVSLTPATDLTLASPGVLNINSAAHGLATGDWVYLYHSAVQDANLLTFAGWYQVTVVDGSNFTINDALARAGTTNDVDRFVVASDSRDIPVLLGTDGNYAMLNGNRDTGIIPQYQFLAMRRAANAINAAMRKVDITIAGYEDFSPWLTAAAGNEFASGQLIVKQPKVFDTFLEVQLPDFTTVFDVFVNSVKRTPDTSAGAVERLFPSRVLSSYSNFPEIFDRPTVDADIDSKSASDINSADGQELTAIVPFFGESAFGASLQAGVVVPFKENSIYLLNIRAKFNEELSLQKLESRGLGCTAPYSVAPTKNGIMFANESGIYRLGRDMAILPYGIKYDRIWKEQVNKDQLYLATGHHFATENQYKLSYCTTDSEENNNVAVYNHTREGVSSEMGSWTTYQNHAATGWANLLTTAYFGTVDGQVFKIRNEGDVSDYRDDASEINWEAVLRALDFGDAGIRKVFGWIITHYRTLVEVDSAELNTAVNLAEEFEPTDAFEIKKSGNLNNFSDLVNKKVVSIRSSVKTRVGIYLQLQYKGSCYDLPVEIAGVEIRVTGKSQRGITEAADTTK